MIKYRYDVNSQIPQVLSIFVMSLAGISYGMLFSWTSPSIPELVEDESRGITFEQASYFTIIPQIPTILVAPIYSLLLNVIGRKKTALLIGVPQLLAWIVTGVADNVFLFYTARFLCGIADAGIFTVLPLYICEISEPGVRGSWGNTLTIFFSIGKFLVILIGAYTTIKITAIFGGCISLLYIILAAIIPESPYYLLMQNREADAKKSLSALRWRTDTDLELQKLKTDIARQMSETGTYKDLFRISSNRRALMITVGLRCALQYSGMVAFESYTQYMFQQAGGEIPEKISAIIFSFVSIPTLCVFARVSNLFGRRKLAIFSAISCAFILSVETIYFGIQQYSNLPLDNFTWVPLAGMLMYIVACCSGLAFIPVLMLGELFSVSVKAKATGINTIALSVNAIIIPKLFQTLTHNFGIFTPFALFTCCTFISSVFAYIYVIETRGKTLEEIQQDLKQKKFLHSKTPVYKLEGHI